MPRLGECECLPGLRLIRARAINADFRRHNHRSILVGVVLRGQRRLVFPDGELHVLPGNGFLLPADLPHRCSIDEAHSYRVASILPGLWQAFAAVPVQAQILCAGSPSLLAARRLVACLRCDHQALAIESCLVALQQTLSQREDDVDDTLPAPERVRKVRDWLDAHCNEAVRLTTLAQIAECSPGLINRLFRQHFGLPPYEYLVQLRLGLAACRLRESDQSLADIAYETGFADQSHLQRFFRRAYGTTPQAYRQASARSGNFSPVPE